MIWRLGGWRRVSGRLGLLLVLLGAPGCFRVNTPRAARASLPSDAVPRQEYKSRLGNPAFYDQFGVRYRVLQTSKDFVERGIASWYGEAFHGRRTSTGEPYDMYAMTAAHKTLPLPTYVRVTDLDTGNRVVVRVNDRGPFVEGRVIDLSYIAAVKLGIADRGTARVEVQALDPPAVDPPGMGAYRGAAMRLWADSASLVIASHTPPHSVALSKKQRFVASADMQHAAEGPGNWCQSVDESARTASGDASRCANPANPRPGPRWRRDAPRGWCSDSAGRR